MSSDESTCTNPSIYSNRSETRQQQLKFHKPEEWEINIIGDFLLDLYHRSIISAKDDWCVKKSVMYERFSQSVTAELKQKLKAVNGTDNIGTLLYNCGFLLNTSRGSIVYKIKNKALFDFRNNKLKKLDYMKINNDGINQGGTNATESNSMLKNSSIVLEEDSLEIDEDEPKISLEYQGSTIQKRETSFCPTNMSCFICQDNFSTMESFEEHVQIHGDDTDFEYLTTLNKFNTPIFTINYRLCKNSHYFCFEFETSSEDLVIEKIIVVQSRSFFYVHNMRVPYKCSKNGMNRFFIDSHLFTIHLEQPIVLICHLEDSKDSLIIEQHHFMRSQEFPKVNFSIHPNRLPDTKLFQPKFQLADYFPPKEIQDALKDDFYHEKLMKTSNEFRDYVRNEKKLQPQTIGASLNILLQIEDMDTIQEYLCLKHQNIKLRSFGDEYSFMLKPKQRIFLENILSAYDEVILTTRTDIFTKNEEILKLMLQNKSDIRRMKNTFVGLIQAVNFGRISFKCDQKINLKDSYVVICRPSRLNFRYQYRSLQLLPINMDFLKKFLFPTKITPMSLSTKSVNLYNENLNEEQLQAVRNIAEGPRNDATYVIFGPPGTGKTTTVVEGILQLLKKSHTKILVTASSNSACDEIALRLCKFLKQLDIKRVMVRIYSRSSEIRTETIDDELLENSNMYNGQFYPDVEILHEYRIVICTLSVLAKLATGKFGRNNTGGGLYTHLFIDEVAASTEVEALVAITTILTPTSAFIISGDHKQLGPVLQSRRAKSLGLDASLMDRLITRDCYRVDVDTGDYDRTIQTRLVRNYRSHPAIVNLYSGLYYNHSLEPHAKPDDVSWCEVWHKSRNKQYPILFHAIYEPSKSDKQSHSLYNLTELQVVMDYVKDLMYFGINGEPVNETDIGIISPYKKQYQRIQEELNLRKWFSIETGSVETFQGKEKSIIIASFVRSGTENLGFLDNPRRLNVTISRPKSLLILIGNPKTLSLNEDFEYIIKECQRNNTFVGSNAPKRYDLKKQPTENVTKVKEMSEINKRMQTLKVENADNETAKKNRRRNRDRERRRGKSNKNQKLNKEDADVSNKNQHNNCPNTSASGKTNSRTVDNSRKGYDMCQSKKTLAANDGKISKQDGKGGQKSMEDKQKNLVQKELDNIFKELPQVPTKTITGTPATYTKEQLLQLQQQQQYYNKLHQQENFHRNNPYFNLPTGTPPACRQTAPVFNPYMVNQQQNFNTLQQPLNYMPQFASAHNPYGSSNLLLPQNPTGINRTNLSCYKNNSNNSSSLSSDDVSLHSTLSNKNNLHGNSTPKPNKGNGPAATGATANMPKNNQECNKNAPVVLNPKSTSKSTNIVKPFDSRTIPNIETSTKTVEKNQEQPKPLCKNLATKEQSTTKISNTTNIVNSNRGDDKPVPSAPVYPGLKQFTTSSLTSSATNNSSIQKNSILYTNSVTSISNNVSTNPPEKNSATNRVTTSSRDNYSNVSNSERRFATAYEAREHVNRPVRNLSFNEQRSKNRKADNSCVLS